MQTGKIIIIVVMALLQACSGTNFTGSAKKAAVDPKMKLLDMGYTIEYADGYELGCQSITSPELYQGKNENRYLAEKEYARGWRQGVATCQNRYGEISKEYWEQRKKELTNEQKWNEIKK